MTNGQTTKAFGDMKTEIIDLLNKDLTCDDLPDYPTIINSASVSFVDNLPVICGGAIFNVSYYSTDDCHILANGTWTFFGKMRAKRTFASNLQLSNTSFQARFVDITFSMSRLS